MIYLLIAIFLVFFAIDEIYFYNSKKSKLISCIIAIILILLAGLRNKVGTDWLAYYEYYTFGVKGIEYGYMFFNTLFSEQLGFHYNVFLLVMNAIAISFLVSSSWKLSPLPALALLLYFSDLYLYFHLSGFRQALATCFTCYALTFVILDKRNLIKFILYIIIASSFHLTALIALLAYFIPQRKLFKKEYVIIVIGFMFFSTLIYFTSSFLTGMFAYKAEYYLKLQEQSQNIKVGYAIGIVRRLIPICLILLFARSNYFQNSVSCFLFNLYLIGLGIFVSSYLISPDIGVRVSSYFIIMEIFMLGHLLFSIKGTNKLRLVLLIILIVSFYKVSTYMSNPDYEYNSIL